MDTYDAIATKLDVREYRSRPVPGDVKLKVLDAGRLTGSGSNSQHWHFILVQDRENLQKLSGDSTTGAWVKDADFAVIILIDAKRSIGLLDAGRALQDMQLAAWNFGVVSRLYTGMNQDAMRADYVIPESLNPAVVLAFGYPAKKITGKRKKRKELSEVASLERFGNPIDKTKL